MFDSEAHIASQFMITNRNVNVGLPGKAVSGLRKELVERVSVHNLGNVSIDAHWRPGRGDALADDYILSEAA